MSRALALGSALVVIAAALTVWRSTLGLHETAPPFEPTSAIIEPPPLCPWREPDADRARFFPGATRHATETRLLSGARVELAEQLGRQPNAGENALTLHRVFKDSEALGCVLVRRVKGEHGLIEVVLAVTERGEARDARIQRLREPPPVARVVEGRDWLATFQGRTSERGWETDDISGLPSEARVSARAVREGIRSLLILLAASGHVQDPSTVKSHH